MDEGFPFHTKLEREILGIQKGYLLSSLSERILLREGGGGVPLKN